MDHADVVVIGAGVVGLAVAAKLAASGREVVILERHQAIGCETSSRNSEVIHAGIYYPSGSAKAALCVRGKALLYQHCEAYGIAHKRLGKLIVATQEAQQATIKGYMRQAERNGVQDLRWVERAEIAELEPDVAGIGGALSPSTGIIDSHAFMLSLQGILESASGMIAFSTPVLELEPRDGWMVSTPDMDLRANWVINCAGLHAPDLARGLPGAPRAHYAKGHYYSYGARAPFNRLVYPVAESGGLGVHVTLDLGGQAKFGPDVRWIDQLDYDFETDLFDNFVAAIRAYFPGLDADKLQPGYTGIRPKIVGPGEPAADFKILSPAEHGVAGRVDLLGIESPGLTASLAIAERVVGLVNGRRAKA